jgi:hypothetical protein
MSRFLLVFRASPAHVVHAVPLHVNDHLSGVWCTTPFYHKCCVVHFANAATRGLGAWRDIRGSCFLHTASRELYNTTRLGPTLGGVPGTNTAMGASSLSFLCSLALLSISLSYSKLLHNPLPTALTLPSTLTHTHMYRYTHAHIHTCTHTERLTHTHVHTQIHIHTNTHTHTQTHTHSHTHTHTHTHTHIHAQGCGCIATL